MWTSNHSVRYQSLIAALILPRRPFLLQSKASYTAIGIFSLASYPYSFKLLWSPLVDSVYSAAVGRRKSWVVPIQLTSAAMMLVWASWADARLQVRRLNPITSAFGVPCHDVERFPNARRRDLDRPRSGAAVPLGVLAQHARVF